MTQFNEEFKRFAKETSIALWGVGDISGVHPLGREYPRAISFLWAYKVPFVKYSEEGFHELLEKIRPQLEQVITQASQLLTTLGIKHRVVPQGGQDPTTLISLFSHKLAATRAGLGWIGKGSFLVTRQFGPRVRLATILFDADVSCGKPVTSSGCGECQECAKACPYGCIRGVNWYPGIPREDLLDAHQCSKTREGFTETMGRKHECGLCLLACPVGK
jgi:epoxyqueuosine reductase